jgi:hypothetical protein
LTKTSKKGKKTKEKMILIKIEKTTFALKIILCCTLASIIGCEPQSPGKTAQKQIIQDESQSCIDSDFAPDKIEIMPLTKMTIDSRQNAIIKVYVSLLDSFNCQKKWPGIFRFEIYQRTLRSTEPKGKRIFIWPDIDLTEANVNNSYWLDFLRAYQFELELEAAAFQDYILQITCLSADNRRLVTESILKPQQKP